MRISPDLGNFRMDATSLDELEKVIKSSYSRNFRVQYTFDVTFDSFLGCIPLLFRRLDRFFHFSLFPKIDGFFLQG